MHGALNIKMNPEVSELALALAAHDVQPAEAFGIVDGDTGELWAARTRISEAQALVAAHIFDGEKQDSIVNLYRRLK